MSVVIGRPASVLVALVCIGSLLLAPAGATGAPPPCEPPAGYQPPPVDLRIVGLMEGQMVGVGTTHDLRAEALDGSGDPWGERFDWYVDGQHVATGPGFRWTVAGPPGNVRVTLVVSSGEGSAWVHVDVASGEPPPGPPSWLGPAVRALPPVAMALWLALVHRQMVRGRAPPD